MRTFRCALEIAPTHSNRYNEHSPTLPAVVVEGPENRLLTGMITERSHAVISSKAVRHSKMRVNNSRSSTSPPFLAGILADLPEPIPYSRSITETLHVLVGT